MLNLVVSKDENRILKFISGITDIYVGNFVANIYVVYI